MATVNVRDGLCSIYSWVCKKPSPSFQSQTETWSLLDNICLRVCLFPCDIGDDFRCCKSNFKKWLHLWVSVSILWPDFTAMILQHCWQGEQKKQCNFIYWVHTSETAYVRLTSCEDRKTNLKEFLGEVCAFWETMLKLWRCCERTEESWSATAPLR